jgi:hypothetical protein
MASDFFAHSLLRAHDFRRRAKFDQHCHRWRCVLAMGGMGGTCKSSIAERFVRILPNSLPENLRNTAPCPHAAESLSFPTTTPATLKHFSNFRSHTSKWRPVSDRSKPATSTGQTCNGKASSTRAARLAGTYHRAAVTLSHQGPCLVTHRHHQLFEREDCILREI